MHRCYRPRHFFSDVPHLGVLPCRRYFARACGHWPFSRLNGSRCWLTVHLYQSPSGQLVWSSTRSPPMTGRSEWRPSDPIVILLRVRTCHMPKEAEPSLSDTVGNWRTRLRHPASTTDANPVSAILNYFCTSNTSFPTRNKDSQMTPKFNDASNFPVLNADSQADRLRGRCINWQHRHINGVVCQTDVSWNN